MKLDQKKLAALVAREKKARATLVGLGEQEAELRALVNKAFEEERTAQRELAEYINKTLGVKTVYVP